jgi:hypothetical protein
MKADCMEGIMIKRSLLALLMLGAVGGDALAASQDINLTATVDGSCTISNSNNPAAVTQALAVSSDGFVSTSPVVLNFPVACNKPATLSMSAVNKGLVGPAAVANYDNKINYLAQTSGLFPVVSLDTQIAAAPLPGGGDPYSSASAGPVQGNLSVTVTPASSSHPLAGGNYADTLRLTITPLQ